MKKERSLRKRADVEAARGRIVLAAMKAPISQADACRIGGFAQAWYHLQILCRVGLLKYTKYNTWIATDRAYRAYTHKEGRKPAQPARSRSSMSASA
jgi:hypothetical protein